jgi:hypothetical protein
MLNGVESSGLQQLSHHRSGPGQVSASRRNRHALQLAADFL